MLQIQIGDLALQPHRQLLSGGERVTLGKRALDILSVLGEANGEIVTKEELFETVWPGVIVEENALQVHIVALRKALGREANRLETIRGIGYRLALEGHAVGEAIPRTNERRRVPTGKARFAGLRTPGKLGLAIAALAVVLAAAFIWTLRPQSEAPRIQVVALEAEGGANADLLAGTLQEDIVGMLSQSGVQATDSAQSGLFPSSSEGGVVLKGSVVETSGRLQVRIFLEDVPSGLTLWSGRYERPVDAADLLTDQVTAAATQTVMRLLETTHQEGFKLNPRLTALYIRAGELTGNPQLLSDGKLLEQIVREAPQFGAGHAYLAWSLTGEASQAAPSDRAPLIARARNEIDTAIRIDPSTAGAAYDARYWLSFQGDRPPSITSAEDHLLDGLRHAPYFPLLSMRECQVLLGVGRTSDALAHCRRAIALWPAASTIGRVNAEALSAAGQRELARRAIDRAARFHPDGMSTRAARLDIAAFYGSPDEAAALLHDPGTVPPTMNEQAIEAYDSFLLARRTGAPADIERAAAAAGAMARNDTRYLGFAVKALTSLGRIDEAFALLGAASLESYISRPGNSYLFEPVTAPLRADRRFWPVVARLGLVEYWTARNRWPDFCGQEMALAACKRAAARAV